MQALSPPARRWRIPRSPGRGAARPAPHGAQGKRFSARPSAFGGFGRNPRRGCASAPPSGAPPCARLPLRPAASIPPDVPKPVEGAFFAPCRHHRPSAFQQENPPEPVRADGRHPDCFACAAQKRAQDARHSRARLSPPPCPSPPPLRPARALSQSQMADCWRSSLTTDRSHSCVPLRSPGLCVVYAKIRYPGAKETGQGVCHHQRRTVLSITAIHAFLAVRRGFVKTVRTSSLFRAERHRAGGQSARRTFQSWPRSDWTAK